MFQEWCWVVANSVSSVGFLLLIERFQNLFQSLHKLNQQKDFSASFVG